MPCRSRSLLLSPWTSVLFPQRRPVLGMFEFEVLPVRTCKHNKTFYLSFHRTCLIKDLTNPGRNTAMSVQNSLFEATFSGTSTELND